MTPTSEGGFPEGSFCAWIGASPGREQRVFMASSGDERRRGLQTLPGQCRAVSKRGSVVTDWSRARGGHGGGGRAVAGPGRGVVSGAQWAELADGHQATAKVSVPAHRLLCRRVASALCWRPARADGDSASDRCCEGPSELAALHGPRPWSAALRVGAVSAGTGSWPGSVLSLCNAD